MMNFIYVEEKIRARINELKDMRYIEPLSLSNWLVREDAENAKFPPSFADCENTFSIGDRWVGRDRYLWIQTEVEIPDTKEILLFVFDFGKTGEGFNSGFESLLFINNQPYQGVDSNHKEVFIDEHLKGQRVTISLKLWSGLEGGGPEQEMVHQFKQAYLTTLVESVDQFYYLSDVLLKTISQLSENDEQKYRLLDYLNRSFIMIDWLKKGTTTFYESVSQALRYLESELEKQPVKETDIEITAIGHTHIDVAWLWRLKHTREKAARSFSTVLKLMEKYSDYTFLQTQPQIYQYIKEDYPEMYEKIKQRIAEGRWEVDGAMWVESDCNIPSGESLTRQILHGSMFIKEEFDKDVNYLWLPDVFGYSWALPQILLKSGINTFMTTKISWNQFNRMPNDTFYWKGIDGSRILTHFVTTPDPKPHESWASEWFYTYNGVLEPETVLGTYDAYRDKDFNSNLLISYGYGDGGGGVNRDMLEKRRKMDITPGLPHVKTGSAKSYFDKLHKTVEKTDHYVHEWDGELYLEYHRGTYTSQAFTKKMNRQTELKLRELEILYAAESIKGNKYPKKALYDLWEILLRNQFHDIIPGSSIKEVYVDHKEEFKEIDIKTKQLISKLEEKTNNLLVINTAGWSRNGLVLLPDKVQTGYMDKENRIYDILDTTNGTYLYIPYISGLSDVCLVPFKGNEQSSEEPVGVLMDECIETPHYILKLNSEGQLARLYDKENKREILKGTSNVLQLFEDKPKDFDAWDIDIFYQEKMREVPFDKVTIGENNRFFIDIMLNAEVGLSVIKQKMRLYRHSRRIDFETDIDWHERQQLLKVSFDVDVRTTEATYDIQYGNVTRPNHWNTSWDMAKFETVGHQWADLSERNYGVSLLNDSKYGYDIKGTVMRLSLLKGGIYPDPTADIGNHKFTYSLLPHKGDFITGKTVEEAWDLNNPLTILQRSTTVLPSIKILNEEVVKVDALKQAENENGWIMRIHDHTGSRRQLTFELPDNFSWNVTNLMEKDEGELIKGDINTELLPYEIQTFRLVQDK